jgi:hypothetical protein
VAAELRAQALELDAAATGFQPTADLPNVFGGIMETGYPGGVATLVGLQDGTTSLYTSTGGGVIGGGEHESVARETRGFLEGLEAALDELDADAGAEPPADGMTVIHALTYDGRRSLVAREDDLGYGRHALSPLFHQAHAVITELRLIEQQP